MYEHHAAPSPPDLPAVAKVLEMIGSSWMSQTVCVAAELGIADLLAGGAKNIEGIAKATSCQPASLHRLMRALASLGLCAERDDGYFAPTPMGSLLRSGPESSVRSWSIWSGRYQWQEWGNLLYSVRTGKSARRLLAGGEGYEHLESDPEAASIFNRAMTELTQLAVAEVVRVYDFSAVRQLIDVGGGYGELLAAILSVYPTMRGVLFDLPHAIEGATARFADAGLTKRCESVEGNFFEAVPDGGDVYLLKTVLHNWNDEQCTVILRNCRRAMSNNSKLVLVERIMPARMTGADAERAFARADLNMLVGIGGRERTEAEFTALLSSSGFKATRFLSTVLDFGVIESFPSTV